MELLGKKVVVVGLGKSGVAAAKLCLAQGARVVATDASPLEALSEAARSLGTELVAGGHQGVDFASADVVVVSPGVPPLPELERAVESGVTVIGELELAYRFMEAPVLAVGGTNGKSTVTTLLGCLLEAGGLRSFVGANLGTPACEAVGEQLDVVLFEVSSFQLERAPTFRPRVSILLNVSEDHLDRYPSFSAYAHAKGNAFANQTPDDTAVVFSGDPECERQARRGQGKLLRYGDQGDYRVEGGEVLEVATGRRFLPDPAKLAGKHNLYNAAAAIAAARAFGVPSEAVERGLAAFEPLGHRMRLVARLGGVAYYDDSKATNVGAAVTALLGLHERRAVLIAGGRDKLGSYEPLCRALQHKGRAVVVLGEAAGRIADAIDGHLPVARAASMEQAVAIAHELAESGDAVLLSPACSSFDMFRDYAHRGDCFAAAVRALAREEGSA